MAGNHDLFGMELWKNGPKPGAFYNFPNITSGNKVPNHTLSPSTTGTSVVGMVYDKGVIIAADTLGSYGSLARFRDCSRVMKVNDSIILGASGDYADYQYLQNVITQKVIDEECMHDSFSMKPKAMHSWLTRVLYNRRCQFDPFWNTFVVGGMEDGVPFLGHVDKIGTAFECREIATGYGAYIALPMLRQAREKKPNLTEKDAIEVVAHCLEVLFYRDARSFYKYELAFASADGTRITGPHQLKSKWDIAHYVGGYE